jgi:hypothetical protein
MDVDIIPMPDAVKDILPAAVRPYAGLIVLGVVGVAALIGLVMLLVIVRFMFGGRKKPVKDTPNLEEDLTEYPDLKSSTTGDRQLRVEGVPVRLRLVVVAPAGTASEVDQDEVAKYLEKVVPGLGDIYKRDKPRLRVWPTQISYQGFATHFHRNTLTGAEDGEQTRWVMIAGRVKLGKQQIMLGLAMQSIKPNTVGRRTVDSHEWASILRVRVKE